MCAGSYQCAFTVNIIVKKYYSECIFLDIEKVYQLNFFFGHWVASLIPRELGFVVVVVVS